MVLVWIAAEFISSEGFQWVQVYGSEAEAMAAHPDIALGTDLFVSIYLWSQEVSLLGNLAQSREKNKGDEKNE